MRFSLTIAATLAVITGSVIAIPGPLHARALEQVNSFERDVVDIYSRNNHLHQLAIEKLESAIGATKSAIDDTRHARIHGFPHEWQRWEGQHVHHSKLLPGLEEMHWLHKNHKMTHNEVAWMLGHADIVTKDAHRSSREAQQAVGDHGHQTAAFKKLVYAKAVTRKAIERTQNVIKLGNNSKLWKDRLAELQKLQSWLEELHESYSKAKEHSSVTQYSEDVAVHASEIAQAAQLLGALAQRTVLKYEEKLK